MKLRWLEATLVSVNKERRFGTFASRLPANNYQYAPGSVRKARRYGIDFDLDISDLIQWYLYFGFLDPSHEAFLALCEPGETVVDVGANIGITAMRASAAVGPEGMVHAFEPDRKNRARFQQHITDNQIRNIRIYPLAVGDRSSAGFVHRIPANSGMTTVTTSPSEDGDEVRIVGLDEWFSAEPLFRLDVFKIDVEGAELEVLRGAQNLIQRFHPKLFVEVDDSNLRSHGTNAHELTETIGNLGYDVQLIGTGAPGEEVHGDLVCTPRSR